MEPKIDKTMVYNVYGYTVSALEPPKKCSLCGVDAKYFDAAEVN